MSILWIIYFIIGALLGLCCIYAAMHEEESADFENELNTMYNNKLGTSLLFIVVMVVALLVAVAWPLAIIIALIKKGNKT